MKARVNIENEKAELATERRSRNRTGERVTKSHNLRGRYRCDLWRQACHLIRSLLACIFTSSSIDGVLVKNISASQVL